MRLGIVEIAVIIVVIIALFLVTRIHRGNRDASEQSKQSFEEIIQWQVKEKVGRKHNHLKRVGTGFIIAGTILALVGMSMFRWAVQSYIWSFIIIGVGFTLLFLIRKK